MDQLTDLEKYIVSVGLNLAGDVLKVRQSEDKQVEITMQIIGIIEKLKLQKQFSKAAASTAGIGIALRDM